MRGLNQLILMSLRLYLREPIAMFFTVAFPPMLVLIFGAMFGNDPTPTFGGRGSMDVSMPAYTALILGTVGIMTAAINISSYREIGVLRRFRATPLQPASLIVADVIANLAMTVIGMVALVLVGRLLYHVHFEGNVGLVALAVVLSGLAMMAIGYMIAGLAPTARTAQIVGMAIFYPMMFLSGTGMPLEVMPATIRRIADFLPLTYVGKLLRGLWFGEPWSAHLLEGAVLGGILLICTVLAARFFRWE